MPDKFTATWVSHSSISDFLKCPRAYYLGNVYKNPQTGHKVKITSPSLSLGSAVHEILESLSNLPTATRFKKSLLDQFTSTWKKFTLKKGGFLSKEQEAEYKLRGEKMIRHVMENPGPLENLSVKIKQELPQFWLSEKEEIILCGKVDWLEYLPDTDTVHIIDFKTGKNSESESSLQLPIYSLLVHNCQQRKADKASYWYLANGDGLQEKPLPDLKQAQEEILQIAKKIKLQKKLNKLDCPHGQKGCFACRPYEAIISGQAELVGQNDFRQDLYLVDPNAGKESSEDSVIL